MKEGSFLETVILMGILLLAVIVVGYIVGVLVVESSDHIIKLGNVVWFILK